MKRIYWHPTILLKNKSTKCFTKQSEKQSTAAARSVSTIIVRYSTYCTS